MMIKRILVWSLIALFLVLSLTGCKIKSKTDMSIRETVKVVGIDEVDGKIQMTIILELVHPSENGDSGTKVAIYTAEGESAFEAIQKYHAYTDKIIFWGHVDYILIGEETAKMGINKYLDLFARDHEIKQNVKILVVQDYRAEDFIKTTNMQDSPLNSVLESLFNDAKNVVSENEVTILKYLQMVSCKKGCLYLPVLTTTDKKEKSEEDEDKKDVFLNGFAIFNDDKLESFLSEAQTNGVSWLMNKNYAGYITIYDKNDKAVVLEVTGNKPDYKIEFTGDVPEVEITLHFQSNIVEYHGEENIFLNEYIDYLIDEQNKLVQNEVINAIEYIQEKKADIIGVSNKVYTKYPKKTDSYEDIWPEIFSKTKINVKVESNIDRTYNINEPVAYDESEDK